jgi:serine protease Do
LDLSLFQFDFGLSWSVLFMNSDKTIYGRYGTRSQFDALRDVSINGFQKAMEAALDLHKGYPGNKVSLAGKASVPTQFKMPEEYPTLTAFKPNVTPGVKRNNRTCMHCHEIQSARVAQYLNAKKPVPDIEIWPFPMPDLLGFVLNPNEKATVQKVIPNTQADKAGFKEGDEIVTMEGQPIISIADVQWILHQVNEPATVHVGLKEKTGQSRSATLTLAAGWRRSGNIMWRVYTRTLRPFMGADLTATERKQLGFTENAIAIRTDDSTSTGIQKDDIITQIDGKKTDLTLSQVVAYILQQKLPGEKLIVGLLRGGKPQTLEIPVK